jgi:hypothetical protein
MPGPADLLPLLPPKGLLRTQSHWLPFLWSLVRGGSIRYTRTAELPLFLLWSFTSSMSGREFMAQRKFAFHVLGSGSFSPALYRPTEQEREVGHQLLPGPGGRRQVYPRLMKPACIPGNTLQILGPGASQMPRFNSNI